MRHYLAFGLVLYTVGIVAQCAACSPSQAGGTAAESAYPTELLRCVDDAKTLIESRTCRQSVNAKWGIHETEAGAR